MFIDSLLLLKHVIIFSVFGMDSEGIQVSVRSRVFFLNIRQYLIKKGISIDGLFHNVIFLKNPNHITQVQFVKIIGLSQSNFNSMEIYEIYNQLKEGSTININRFINMYKKVDNAHSLSTQMNHQQMRQQPQSNSVQESNRQVQKKMLRLGLLKLQKYVREGDAIQLFKQCDEEGTGYLSKKQFNKFMVATDIKELSDHNIRHVLIKKLFSYYENERMSFKNFISLFKIKEEDIKKKPQQQPKSEPQKVPQPHPIANPMKKHIPFQKNSTTSNQNEKVPIFSAASEPEPKFKHSSSDNSMESNQIDILNVREIFPKSYSLYRLGLPAPEDLKYFQILQAHIEANQIYRDDKNPIAHIGKYEPASKFFHGKYQIFQMASSVLNRQKSRIGLARQIQPKDIMQGQIGDCYFLSSIASVISFYPQIVSGMFLFGPNPAHFFALKLFIDGEWLTICTDDQFPCQYGKPVYAKPHGNQIWVMLLEKCFAKVYGSYKAIDSGTPTEGFRALTGAPAVFFSTENDEEQMKKLHSRLEQSYNNKYVATASGSKYLCSMSQTQQQKIGLIGDHAYSFLKFLKMNDETVVKMRNPWGKTIWKGQWSFQSKKWTPNLRDKYNYHSQHNDGAFYMPWNQFKKYFTNFVICRLDPTFIHTSHKINSVPHKSNYIRMTVKESGTYNISIYQQGKRKFPNQNYQYSPVRFVVLKQKAGNYEFMFSANKSKSHAVFQQAHLQRGLYYIAVKVSWENSNPKPIILTSYGCQKVDFETLDNSIAPIFKKQMINSFSLKHRGKIKKYQKLKLPEATCETHFSIEHGIGYIKVKNPTGRWFKSTLTLSSNGLKIIKPDTLPCVFNMDGNSEKIIGFWVSSKGYSYESSESMETKGW